MRTILLSSAIGLLAANAVVAADSNAAPECCGRTHECCLRCGVPKTCKIVCEMKKIEKTCWVVECEEFCTSLPGCGRLCKPRCGDCDARRGTGCGSDSCASPGKTPVPPRCSQVRTRKKLTKREIVSEIPVYKCVVVCCNTGCDASCDEVDQAAPAAAAGAATALAPLPQVLLGYHPRK